MFNVLLVEDDLDLAETVIQYLELEDIRCDHASNGVAGLELLNKSHFDCVLLDLNLPRLDGLSVCQQLRKKGDDTPVLMLTARCALEDKLQGFRSGSDDYLVKPFELDELVVRIQALARRRSGQVRLLSYADLEMNLDSRLATRAGQALKLSPTAWNLLETLLRASPNVVTRAELEEAVWGDDLPDSNALKVHLYHLRKQVDADFDKPLIQTIQGHGFALKEKDAAP